MMRRRSPPSLFAEPADLAQSSITTASGAAASGAAPRSSGAAGDWVTAHCDGGARGNPGPAGYGAEITGADGAVLAELSEFLGICTNNVAEYSGLLASLQWALDHGVARLRVVSDSELMVKQIQGRYKVNSPDLKPLWQEAKSRIARLGDFQITHALRHKNKAADRLANEAMDRGMGRGPDRGMAAERPAGRAAESARATPYPQRGSAPPAPCTMDPAPKTAAPPIPIVRIGNQRSATPAGVGAGDGASGSRQPQAPAMLRGFTRDGVVHLLDGAALPDGVFVKIVRE
jgi:ribonuclease HI